MYSNGDLEPFEIRNALLPKHNATRQDRERVRGLAESTIKHMRVIIEACTDDRETFDRHQKTSTHSPAAVAVHIHSAKLSIAEFESLLSQINSTWQA